jgi:hypothetical protein
MRPTVLVLRTAGVRGASEVTAVGPDGERRAGEGIGAGVGLDRGGCAADEAAVDVVALRADRGPGCIGVGVDHDETATGPGVERRVLLVVGEEREIGAELGADAVAPCVENLTDQVRAGSGGDRAAGSFGPHHDVAAGAYVDDVWIGLIAGVGEVRLLRRPPYFRCRGHDVTCLVFRGMSDEIVRTEDVPVARNGSVRHAAFRRDPQTIHLPEVDLPAVVTP